jgi:hypothetical protein
MRNSAATAAVRRRVAAAEAAIAKRWLERVSEVLGDELLRHPKADQRAVIMRLHDFRQRLGAGTLERPGDDVSIAIMREVRAAAPTIADAVEQRLGVNMTRRDGVS